MRGCYKLREGCSIFNNYTIMASPAGALRFGRPKPVNLGLGRGACKRAALKFIIFKNNSAGLSKVVIFCDTFAFFALVAYMGEAVNKILPPGSAISARGRAFLKTGQIRLGLVSPRCCFSRGQQKYQGDFCM